MWTTVKDKKKIVFTKNNVCKEVHKPLVKKSSKKINSQEVNVFFHKGCIAAGFCNKGPFENEVTKCGPAFCKPCININNLLELTGKNKIPSCHDPRLCKCVKYKKPDERSKMTKEIANNLYQEYVSSGNLAKQIEIENFNRKNNIWSINRNLDKPLIFTMKKVDLKDLFKPKDISYASFLLSNEVKSSKDESTDSVSTDSVSSDSISTDSVSFDSISTDSLSSDSLSSDSVSSDRLSDDRLSSEDEYQKDKSPKDESDKVKSNRLLLLKFQNLEKLLIKTGNGTENELKSISKSINLLTERLKKFV